MHSDCSQCKQKGLSLVYVLVGILILVIVAGGVFFLSKSTFYQNFFKKTTPKPSLNSGASSSASSTTDKTANWKTYTSAGLSFKYPPDNLEIVQESKDTPGKPSKLGTNIVVFKMKELASCKDCSRIIIINAIDNSKNLSLEQILEQRFSSSKLSVAKDFQKIIVGSEPGLYSVNGIPAQEYGQGVFVRHKDKIYSFIVNTWQVPSSKSNETWDILNQMLSTFKFTQ